MKLKDFFALEKRLSTTFQDFIVKNQFMILPPMDHTLKGFHFDGSSFDRDSFYVSTFFMPLCVPAKQIHLTFGKRIRDRGVDRWNIKASDLESVLVKAMLNEAEFLRKLHTPEDVANALEVLIEPNAAGYVNPHCYEAFAYTLIEAGNTARALKIIELLLRSVNFSVSWEDEIASRAQLIGDKLRQDPKVACGQLSEWTADNIRRLGFENLFSMGQR